MKLVIDMHVFIWADSRPRAIAPPLRAAMLDSQNSIFVSAASIWEIAVKRAAGKLLFEREIVGAVGSLGYGLLPIGGVHAEYAGGLPYHHRNPFDRILVAQAALEGMVLGTQDPLMRPYGIATLGLDRA